EPWDQIARALALEAANRLEPLLVVIPVVKPAVGPAVVPAVKPDVRARRRGNQQRRRRTASTLARRRHDGEAVGLQREIDLGPAAPGLRGVPVIRGPAAPPV